MMPTKVVTVTAPVTKLCPYKDEIDAGTATLTFHVQDEAPELHGVARVLGKWASERISHERYSDLLLTAFGPECVAVRTVWTTGGMEVTVDVPGDQH